MSELAIHVFGCGIRGVHLLAEIRQAIQQVRKWPMGTLRQVPYR